MRILIYVIGQVTPIDTWENYPVVPNVGDKIGGYTKVPMIVKNRTFYENTIVINVEQV